MNGFGIKLITVVAVVAVVVVVVVAVVVVVVVVVVVFIVIVVVVVVVAVRCIDLNFALFCDKSKLAAIELFGHMRAVTVQQSFVEWTKNGFSRMLV